jgi:hypothetical protein
VLGLQLALPASPSELSLDKAGNTLLVLYLGTVIKSGKLGFHSLFLRSLFEAVNFLPLFISGESTWVSVDFQVVRPLKQLVQVVRDVLGGEVFVPFGRQFHLAEYFGACPPLTGREVVLLEAGEVFVKAEVHHGELLHSA